MDIDVGDQVNLLLFVKSRTSQKCFVPYIDSNGKISVPDYQLGDSTDNLILRIDYKIGTQKYFLIRTKNRPDGIQIQPIRSFVDRMDQIGFGLKIITNAIKKDPEA